MEKKILSKNWNKINPNLIQSYQAVGGYKMLRKCLSGKLSPKTVLDQITKSGLRGRGGAGFPTGTKWKLALESKSGQPKKLYFIVNADESQPGTFKDRYIIEKNPHSLIEGAAIACYALKAAKGFIYVNGHHFDQFKLIEKSLEAAQDQGLLGEKLGSEKICLRIQAVRGSGGYIFGEETTLINSLQASLGEARLKPPYPTQNGLFGCPTIVNNVETVANIPTILEMGADQYRKIGDQDSTGTKLFSVLGPVKKSGLFELPLGLTIRELLYDVCGGLQKGRMLDFVQIGWMGNFFTRKSLDYKIVYDIGEKQAGVGLGSVLFVDKYTDLKGLILGWARFFERESCGQCTPCREGTYRLLNIAERLEKNYLFEKDWSNLQDILEVLEKTSLCPFGKFAAQCWQGIIKLKGKEFFTQAMRKGKQ
ncbi:MAG: NADH-quinone oxidoreductase subunit F [Candidatus Moranbacteria bacterium]|nr:NADH-quinone oxidoreductase subunit F [Candidatus Moranbacteria bacterium]